jgi:hypothetical protein
MIWVPPLNIAHGELGVEHFLENGDLYVYRIRYDQQCSIFDVQFSMFKLKTLR